MSQGLRQRKKQQTRELITSAAAALFAEHGYENVTIKQVAEAADVAEQTVYNYFLTKERLVLDRDEEFESRLTAALRDRSPGTSPAGALRDLTLETLDRIGSLDAARFRGGMPYLAAVSPAIRRLCLEMTDRHAEAMAQALRDTNPSLGGARAKLHATALVWLFQTIIDQSGAMTVAGLTPSQVAAALRPAILEILDDLEALTGYPG